MNDLRSFAKWLKRSDINSSLHNVLALRIYIDNMTQIININMSQHFTMIPFCRSMNKKIQVGFNSTMFNCCTASWCFMTWMLAIRWNLHQKTANQSNVIIFMSALKLVSMQSNTTSRCLSHAPRVNLILSLSFDKCKTIRISSISTIVTEYRERLFHFVCPKWREWGKTPVSKAKTLRMWCMWCISDGLDTAEPIKFVKNFIRLKLSVVK